MANYGNILVVDDNPNILFALKICLQDCFERVLTLPKPDGILSLLQQESVSIVLLDMNFSLGVNSGREGIMWLQTLHRRHPHLPIVLMTAYADIPLAVKGLKAGAADFVTKPWENEELLRKLKDAIEKSRDVISLEQLEAEHIHRVVDSCQGNISRAAELLGVTRQTIYAKLKK